MATTATTAGAAAPASTTETTATKKGPKAHHVSGIPEARLKRLFDEGYINHSVHEATVEVKKKLAPYARADKALESGQEEQFDAAGKPILDDNKKPTFVPLTDARRKELTEFLQKNTEARSRLTEEQHALSRARIRFSEDSGRLLRDVIVFAIRELIRHAADNCMANSKVIIKRQHLQSEGAESLVCWPLIQRLPSWNTPPPEPVKKTEGDGEKPAVAPAAEEPASTVHRSDPFLYYINDMCSEFASPTNRDANHNAIVRTTTYTDPKTQEVSERQAIDRVQTGKYHSIRTSNDVKLFLSTLILEMFDLLSPLFQRQLDALRLKTIGEDVILSVIEPIMDVGLTATETLEYQRNSIPDPEVLKAVKAERAAARREKREPTDKRTDDQLPQVEQLVIRKTLTVQESRYVRLQAALEESRALWPSSGKSTDGDDATTE